MIVLDKAKQQTIHRRQIDTTIYEGASDTIVVEGSLEDRRFLDSHLPDGEVRPPFTVHHMIIRMELALPELQILDIDVEMPSARHEACHEARACLEPVIGMRIAAGFTARVRKVVDRKKGCTHLQTLLAAMAPAAFQGAWSARVSRPVDPEILAGMSQRLVNTCWTWREDGPLARTRLHRE